MNAEESLIKTPKEPISVKEKSTVTEESLETPKEPISITDRDNINLNAKHGFDTSKTRDPISEEDPCVVYYKVKRTSHE